MIQTAKSPEDSRQAAARVRTARRACFAAEPDLFFATHFLPKAQRHAVDSLAVVLAQLRQIMIPKCDSPAKPLGHAAGGSSCATPADCADCGGESVERRREVCSAVLDYLLSGQSTGKPELDGFAAIACGAKLDRGELEGFCDGLAIEASLPRYATWKRLRQMCDQTAGAAALLAFAMLQCGMHPETPEALESPISPLPNPIPARRDEIRNPKFPVRDQILAWGSALRMARLLDTVGQTVRAGRSTLPLDDLVKFHVKESEISALAAAGSLTAGSDIAGRWGALMAFEIERVRRLYDGGVGCLAALPGASRRAAAIFGEMQMARLSRLERAGYDAFAQPPNTNLWQRLAILPVALRRAMGNRTKARR